MKHKCSACGHEDEINPAALLGAMRSDKKAQSSRKNGAKVRELLGKSEKPASLHVGGIVVPPDPPAPKPVSPRPTKDYAVNFFRK